MKQNTKVSLLLAGLIIMGGISANAGTAWEYGFSTTVPRFNGSGYTKYQTKSTSSKAAEVKNTSVGGKYVVDVRLDSADRKSSWIRNVNNNMDFPIPNTIQAKESCRLQFSNDLDTPVNVQVGGDWRSN